MESKEAALKLLELRKQTQDPRMREALQMGELALVAEHRRRCFIERWRNWTEGGLNERDRS